MPLSLKTRTYRRSYGRPEGRITHPSKPGELWAPLLVHLEIILTRGLVRGRRLSTQPPLGSRTAEISRPAFTSMYIIKTLEITNAQCLYTQLMMYLYRTGKLVYPPGPMKTNDMHMSNVGENTNDKGEAMTSFLFVFSLLSHILLSILTRVLRIIHSLTRRERISNSWCMRERR